MIGPGHCWSNLTAGLDGLPGRVIVVCDNFIVSMITRIKFVMLQIDFELLLFHKQNIW